MGYDVRYEVIFSERDRIIQRLMQWEDELREIQKNLVAIEVMPDMKGVMADNIRAYILEVHYPILDWFFSCIETYRANLILYTSIYANMDSDRMARYKQECFENQIQKLSNEKNIADENATNIQTILSKANQYMEIEGFDITSLENNYDQVIAYVNNVKDQIGAIEEIHACYDMENVDLLLNCIQVILKGQQSTSIGIMDGYYRGDIKTIEEYLVAENLFKGQQEYIENVKESVILSQISYWKQKKEWETAVLERELQAKENILLGVGIGVALTVSLVETLFVGLPYVLATLGTVDGAVSVGAAGAVYVAAYGYNGANIGEALDDLEYAKNGDVRSLPRNGIRDTLFASNPDLYYTLGNISLTAAMSLPSIASSMSVASEAGKSPLQAGLKEAGKITLSEAMGNHTENMVRDITGNQWIANIAGSATSLLVYGGTAAVDSSSMDAGKIIDYTEYDNIYHSSIHNAGKDKVMLGKYDGGGPTSYITKAGDDYTYFDLGKEWDNIKLKYGFTDSEMFELFNEAFLEDGINERKIFQFSHNPFFDQGALGQEYQYLLKNNYIWDSETMTMSPID